MKKIFTMFIMLGAITISKAQISTPTPGSHTLSFSQALILSPVSSNYYQVPANTVWKIESASLVTSTGIGSNSNDVPVLNITPPGGSVTTTYFMGVLTSVSQTATALNSVRMFPMWLPAGTKITIPSGGSGLNLLYVLEFTVN